MVERLIANFVQSFLEFAYMMLLVISLGFSHGFKSRFILVQQSNLILVRIIGCTDTWYTNTGYISDS